MFLKKKYLSITALTAAAIIIVMSCLPGPRFKVPSSTVLFDQNGLLLGARIAEDGQWRFPDLEELNEKAKVCMLNFEDRYFYYHPGFNPISLFRAILTNIKEGSVILGGSTITMQLARMWYGNRPRTYFQKFKEILLAIRFELSYTKDEILKMYLSYAPYGGNVIGYETAAWRYYGRSMHQLSWAEHAALAVLPNAPSIIFPGRHRDAYLSKRNLLLDKLMERGYIDVTTNRLSKLEDLPGKPFPLPDLANHLLDRVSLWQKGQINHSTINYQLQKNAQSVVNNYAIQYASNEVYNAAAIIANTLTGEILAYVGNATYTQDHDNLVDVIIAPRSTGSLLKPLLYSSALSYGEALPSMIISDIPTTISGYTPKNYFEDYDGIVHLDEALTRSLNIPFVRLLQDFGVERFYDELKMQGVSSLSYEPSQYGLTLILGGAEISLLELTGLYANMARTLNASITGGDFRHDLKGLCYETECQRHINYSSSGLHPGALYHVLTTMKEVNRPVSQDGWRNFSSGRDIAWKTGTSFGNKDAWAIGTTPEYTIGVWVGNADGEGRAGLTGLNYAAPIMFELFELMPSTSDFVKPDDFLTQQLICKESGYVANSHCPNKVLMEIPMVQQKLMPCNYHKLVHLDKDEKYQVHSACEPIDDMVTLPWFVLSPAQEWFYIQKTIHHRILPPFRDDCISSGSNEMEFVYPKENQKIFLPKYSDGRPGEAIFELAHRHTETVVHWHLDDNYLGSTVNKHQMSLNAANGMHTLLVVDANGIEKRRRFEIVGE